MWYISLEWYLLHCVLHNDHSLRCVDWKLTSAAPCIHKVYTWHKVSVTSHLSTLKGHMSPLCSQQWHGSWLTDLRPSKSNGKDSNFFLRVLWAHMSEYFHFMCRPLLLHRMTLVSFRLFRKHWGNLREFFWANSLPPPPPRGKKLPVCLWIYCIIQILKYEIHNIVTSISNKNYYGAFNSTLLFSDLSFGLVSIKH